MSYDVDFVVDLGGPEEVVIWSANHTSNTAPMWREAGCDITEFNGKTAAELALVAADAAYEIDKNRDLYERYEAPNGWGTIDTTLSFLRAIAEAGGLYPKATVLVYR